MTLHLAPLPDLLLDLPLDHYCHQRLQEAVVVAADLQGPEAPSPLLMAFA